MRRRRAGAQTRRRDLHDPEGRHRSLSASPSGPEPKSQINEPASIAAPGPRVLMRKERAKRRRALNAPVPARLESATPRLRAARRVPSRRTGAVGRPHRIGAPPEGDVSRSRSLPLPDGPLPPDDPEWTRPGGLLACLRPSGETVCPSRIGTGAYPRLPRNLRPDSWLEVLTKVASSSFPFACRCSPKTRISAPPESRSGAVAGSMIFVRHALALAHAARGGLLSGAFVQHSRTNGRDTAGVG